MSLLRAGAVILAVASLSACASITRGTKQQFYVNSDPSGAEVEMSNGLRCRTPCKLKVGRKSDFVVRVIKDGYQPAEVHVQGKVKGGGAAGGLAGNALLGGVIGLGIDASTGAMLNLRPNPVTVTLVPVGSEPAAASGATSDAGPAATVAMPATPADTPVPPTSTPN